MRETYVEGSFNLRLKPVKFSYEDFISLETTFVMLLFEVYTTLSLILWVMLLIFFFPPEWGNIVHKPANSTGNIESRKILINFDHNRKFLFLPANVGSQNFVDDVEIILKLKFWGSYLHIYSVCLDI